ncbi:MAG: PEGA domain-containing protein [Polyangiaceae bacterium]
MARALPLLAATFALGLPVAAAAEPRTSLWIDAPEGASVSVDGEVVGVAPLKKDVGVPPGHHVVTATSNGHREGRADVDIALGEKRLVSVELDDTAQRRAAYALIGSGLGGLAVAIAAGVAAVVKQREASSLDPTFDSGALADAESARDTARIVSGVAGGVGLGLVLTGGLLFAFDAPRATPKKSEAAWFVVPLVAPSWVGVACGGVFP